MWSSSADLEPASDDFSLPYFAVLCGLPESACLRLHGANPLPCSRASQRSLQVRNAGEWWVWKGERTTACEPARSPARAPVTAPMITLRSRSLRAGHKIIVLQLLHITNLLLPYYYRITSSLLLHYYNITTLSLLHIILQLLLYYYTITSSLLYSI